MTEKKKGASGTLRLAKLMRPYLKMLIVCILCVLGVNAAQLAKPYIAAVVIDDFLVGAKEQHGVFSVTGMGSLYFIIAAVGAMLSVVQVRLISRISQNILHEMRMRVFNTIMRLPVALLDKYGTGRLITRATNDVEAINEFYTEVFLNLFKDVFLLVGIVVMIFSMDASLAAVSMTGVPLIVLLTFSIKRQIKRNFKKIKRITGQINGFFSESLAGMRIIQTFNRQKEKHDEFQKMNIAFYKAAKVQVMLNSFLRPSMDVINSLVTALIIAFGYHRIAGGTLEIGVLYAFTNYVKQFFEPIDDLAEKYTTVQSASVSMDRIYELLDEDGLEDQCDGGFTGPVKGGVEFRNVWFAYSGEDWVLKNVSFSLKPGQKAAFVGHTGAGKTTIISLLGRYYVPQRGEILIDGVNISDWRLDSLRSGAATVLQDIFLFTGTIRENISMEKNAADEKLNSALALAGADEFLKDCGGLDAEVTEQGLNFSTGQRQLLSFARAVIGDPGILVLDEATAHVDSNTERMIQRSIGGISRGRTCIFIAHRLSTIRDCDIIFVIDGGKIVESGKHEELIAKNGLYAALTGKTAENSEGKEQL